jgi:hypothetical protein
MSDRFMPALRAWRRAVLINSSNSSIDGGETAIQYNGILPGDDDKLRTGFES